MARAFPDTEDALCSPPGAVHQIVNAAGPLMELSWVCLQWTLVSDAPCEVDRLVQNFADGTVVLSADGDMRLAAQWGALAALAADGVLPVTGVSPAAYIAHAPMDRARGLLVHTQMPVKDVAAAVACPDVHHFTRVFNWQSGCPPGEYRRDPMRRLVPNVQLPGELV